MDKLKKKLLLNRIGYILYNIVMLLNAYFFNRFFQMLLFILFYNTIQNCFKYRFHSDTLFPDNPIKAVRYCKLITFVVEIVYLAFCKDLDVSIYSNLFVIFIICFMNALLQFYCERTLVTKDIFSDKDKLVQVCKDNKLTDIAINRLVKHYIEKKTIYEIALEEQVEDITIKQSIRRSKRRLGL